MWSLERLKKEVFSLIARVNRLESSSISTISLLDVYPIGSIYISVNSTNPSALFGGTWEAFSESTLLLGVNTATESLNDSEITGGDLESFLTNNGLPSYITVYMFKRIENEL